MRSATARRPRTRRAQARLAALLSATGALLLAVTVVWQSASAGFTAPTAPVRATVGTGSVTLTDDDAEGRLFSVAGLKPGDTATRCIQVTSTSPAPADVRLYVTGRSSSNGMASWLRIGVRVGTGGGFGSCSGFSSASAAYDGTLADFPADSFADGRGNWTTAGTTPPRTPVVEKRTYEIKYTLDANTPARVQDGVATATFVWEARTR